MLPGAHQQATQITVSAFANSQLFVGFSAFDLAFDIGPQELQYLGFARSVWGFSILSTK